MPKGIKGFQKGHPNYNIIQTEESRRKKSLAKMGDKNPAKRLEVREKIRQSIIALNQKDENHPSWKGEEAGRNPKHMWVKRHKGMPEKCELCGTIRGNRRFDWANKDHTYKRNLEDYMWICRSCHRKWDIKHNGYLIGANKKKVKTTN